MKRNAERPPSGAEDDYRLPYSAWWPLLAGVLAGITLRLIFSGRAGGAYATMLGAFVYLSPMLVGAVTVYVAERQARRSWSYYVWASFMANVLCVIAAMLILIEGLICAVVIVPLFSLLGSVGGLLMGAVCRLTNRPSRTLLSVGVLPVLLGALEPNVPLPDGGGSVERTIMVDAPSEEIWQHILDAPSVAGVDEAWAFRIGVPMPLSGVTRQTPAGAVRRVTMAKDVYFDEVITEARENRYLHWTYRFHEDSFPPHAMDEHVVIGGHYFDLESTSYTLTPHGEQTELSVQIAYRVSTRFNWYAEPVVRFLLGDVAEANLRYYRRRSEAR